MITHLETLALNISAMKVPARRFVREQIKSMNSRTRDRQAETEQRDGTESDRRTEAEKKRVGNHRDRHKKKNASIACRLFGSGHLKRKFESSGKTHQGQQKQWANRR